jgi:hypothetical protein
VKEGGVVCGAYRSANAACFGCIASTSKDKTSGVLTWFADYGFYLLNIGGCIALARGEAPLSGCGFAYQRYSECRALSCEQVCYYDTTAEFDEFGKCYQRSATTSCGKYRAGYNSECYDINVDPTIDICVGDGRTDAEHFADMATVFCGGAAPDGGIDASVDAADAADASDASLE